MRLWWTAHFYVYWIVAVIIFQAQKTRSSHHGTRFCRYWNLTPKQYELCVLYKYHMPSLGHAAREAISHCRKEFQNRRWNCTVPGRHPLFERIDSPNKESAYTYAIASAAIVYQIARACAADEIPGCACAKPTFEGRPASKNNKSSCSDNVDYAARFSKQFLDATELVRVNDKPKHRSRALMNLHNNALGRKVVRDTMVEDCKCHGVSGACNMKTCWRRVAPMQLIASALTYRYDAAIKVKLGKQSGTPALIKLRNRKSGRYPDPDHMVYVDESPDYCETNTKRGIPGTRGRVCLRNGHSVDYCPSLCCDRGSTVISRTEWTSCRCQFIFCCKVKCQKCKTVVEEAVCL